MLRYYPFSSSQWNAVAAVLKDLAALFRGRREVKTETTFDVTLENDATDALERAKVAYTREQRSIPEKFGGPDETGTTR